MTSFTTLKYANQIMFDQICEELIQQEGLSIEEASIQTIDMFKDEYDLTKVYIYQNKKQYDDKLNIQRICNTIKKAADKTETFVNANFGLQTLIQIIKDNNSVLKLLESYKVIISLIKLLAVDNKDDDNNDMIGEDEDDEDDEEDDRQYQTIRVLDALQFISLEIIKNNSLVYSTNEFFNIGSDNIDILIKRLDEDISIEEIVIKIIEFLLIILSFENNRTIFKDIGGIDLLELSVKMNKKNNFIKEAVEKIKTI